jgi:hypothetical protein
MGDGTRIGAASKRNDLVAIEISRVAPEPGDHTHGVSIKYLRMNNQTAVYPYLITRRYRSS